MPQLRTTPLIITIIIIIIILIIYHDFLPPVRRGSHVKSDNTHTVINIHPLAHILDICALIFISCAIFYHNRIVQRHPTPLQEITTRAWDGGPKEHRAKQKWPRETHSVTYVLGLSTLSDLLRVDPSLHRHSRCPRPHSNHPPSVSSISLVPIPFWPYDTHPFFPHAKTISILPDQLYSLTPILFQSPTHLFIFNSIIYRLCNNNPISIILKDTLFRWK